MISPRLIRARDAPEYCGMGRTVFERDVRPCLTVIPVGRDGIAFDRLDLDAWIEQHKVRSGRPPTKGATLWADPPALEASLPMSRLQNR